MALHGGGRAATDKQRNGRFELSTDIDGVAVVRIHGDLDVESASTLADVIESFALVDVNRVHLDGAAMTFLDCAGLCVIAAAARRLDALGGRLTMTSGCPEIRRLITVAGLTSLVSLDEHDPGRDSVSFHPTPIGPN